VSADPKVLAALQAAHDAEATASEKWHKQEHAFKNTLKKYCGLKRWFDHRHKEAYDRQHDLRKQMMRLGGTVETELGDTSYTEDPNQAFGEACAIFEDLISKYEDIRTAAKDAGDFDTREAFHGVIHDLNKTYQMGEQKLQQIKDLGLPAFLATQL
jgi:bacterioferritin (cytochrome b1)